MIHTGSRLGKTVCHTGLVAASTFDVAARAAAFVERPDISARSTLVTVLGDTIAPLGGEVALSALFRLLAPFPFSQRLIRTSLSRLAAEGWVTSERTGRLSRYHLTADSAVETAAAERRIYHRPDRPWSGRWVLVLVADDDPAAADLRKRGFARLGPGVLAAPETGGDHEPRQVVDELGLADRLPVAAATFDRPDLVAGGQLLTAGYGLDDLVDDYRAFIARYRPWADGDLGSLTPEEAFALRTMVVHELRRLRLRDPLLPDELLPPEWLGDQAFAVAASCYRAVTDRAWAWATNALGTDHQHHDGADPSPGVPPPTPPPLTLPSPDGPSATVPADRRFLPVPGPTGP